MKIKKKDILTEKITAVGNLLVKRNYVFSYTFTKNSKKTFSFKFKIFKTKKQKISLSREILFEKEMFHADVDFQKDDPYLIKVSDTISVYQLYKFFRSIIDSYQLGYAHEQAVFENIERIIEKDISVLKGVHFVKRKQDIKGTDVRITCRNREGAEWIVPLQIKSSAVNQITHKGRFPKIPSLVFLGNNHCPVKLQDQLIKICLSYNKDTIVHV